MSALKDIRHTLIGGKHRAMSRYYMMLYRVQNWNNSRNMNYQGIEVRVPKEEFIKWFMERDFTRCSVDRIDKTGHYELSNMQVIPLWQNIAKEKVKAKDGVTKCYSCGEVKTLEGFVGNRERRTTGKTNICKKCERKRRNPARQVAYACAPRK